MPVETVHAYHYRCGHCGFLGAGRSSYGQAQQDGLDHWNVQHPVTPGSRPSVHDPRGRSQARPHPDARPGAETVYVLPEAL